MSHISNDSSNISDQILLVMVTAQPQAGHEKIRQSHPNSLRWWDWEVHKKNWEPIAVVISDNFGIPQKNEGSNWLKFQYLYKYVVHSWYMLNLLALTLKL